MVHKVFRGVVLTYLLAVAVYADGQTLVTTGPRTTGSGASLNHQLIDTLSIPGIDVEYVAGKDRIDQVMRSNRPQMLVVSNRDISDWDARGNRSFFENLQLVALIESSPAVIAGQKHISKLRLEKVFSGAERLRLGFARPDQSMAVSSFYKDCVTALKNGAKDPLKIELVEFPPKISVLYEALAKGEVDGVCMYPGASTFRFLKAADLQVLAVTAPSAIAELRGYPTVKSLGSLIVYRNFSAIYANKVVEKQTIIGINEYLKLPATIERMAAFSAKWGNDYVPSIPE